MAEENNSNGLLIAYAALLGSALIPIVAGSHSSLVMPKVAKKALRTSKGEKEDPEDDEEDEEIDRLTAGDAYLFPVIGSVVLFSLFLAFKYLDKAMINKILGVYFSFIGTGALATALGAAGKAVTSEKRWRAMDKWRIALLKNKANVSELSFTWINVAGVALAIGVAAYQRLVEDHWTLANIVALSLSFNAIGLLRLDSFFTGAALLGGLFLYDIWWVFGSKMVSGTSVMVSVAQNFEAPIKIVFPKDLSTQSGFTLLGLGDIVLPGIFIALCLRFDYHLALKRNAASPPTPSSAFPKPYFWSCFVSYIAGLVATIYVMHTFKAAQPALLYLSPACVGSVTLCAWWRKELPLLWGYDDGVDDPKSAAKKTEEKQKKAGKDGEIAGAVEVGESTATEARTLRSRNAKVQ